MSGWDDLATAGYMVLAAIYAGLALAVIALVVGLIWRRPVWIVLGGAVLVPAALAWASDLVTLSRDKDAVRKVFEAADAARDKTSIRLPDSLLLEGVSPSSFTRLPGCGRYCDETLVWLMTPGRFL